MADLTFDNIGISHLQACVPENTIINRRYTDYFSEEEADAIVDKTGIEERRFAKEGVCSSDLVYHAAKKLIDENSIDLSQVKFLIFVSQTADYKMPASSVILQHRLGLGQDCMAFDMNLGCSGFVYGLSTMYSLVQSAFSDKAKGLLLVGETRSRVYSARDRKTAYLFGDAGVACLISKGLKFGESHFDLNSNGELENLIKINTGGSRNPSTVDSLTMEITDSHGNVRTEEHGYMDGTEVFNFVISNIPNSVKSFLNRIELAAQDVSFFVFHQANKFMNNHLKKKLRIPNEKYISNLDRFGNTSSVSIPLVISTEMLNNTLDKSNTLLCGFGVGMSWANALLDLNQTQIGDLLEC